MAQFIDTHCHIDGEEFSDDLPEVIQRAREAGAKLLMVPAINMEGLPHLIDICKESAGYCLPMIGLHPEEVKADYARQIAEMKSIIDKAPFVAIGEIGLDFYWSREFETEQLEAFRMQVEWSIEVDLPLMIHCRKAQNEMVKILRSFEGSMKRGGVFHCFTGNEKEAAELLAFDGFCLGIGGVSTFMSSHLPEVLPQAVPLERIVLETDSPYMAPVPHRGKRNEPSFVPEIINKLAAAYGVDYDTVCAVTTATAERLFCTR